MRAVVVDDEAVARRRLIRMLGRLEGIEVIGEAADGEAALEEIVRSEPDVALLDIQMPGLDGLELARRLPERTRVIFTTAFEEFAVDAFEASAVDYLLKPIEAGRLQAALEKARRRREAIPPEALESLLRRLGGDEPPRVTARRGETLHIFDAREVVRFHSGDGYTAFRHGGRSYLTEETLTTLEERLRAWGFLRVHRSELIQLDRIRALRKEDGLTSAELEDGQIAPVSRRLLGELRRRLGLAEPG